MGSEEGGEGGGERGGATGAIAEKRGAAGAEVPTAWTGTRNCTGLPAVTRLLPARAEGGDDAGGLELLDMGRATVAAAGKTPAGGKHANTHST